MSNKQIHRTDENIKMESISVCDLLKDNTRKIIHKCETQTPIYVQLYSNYYTEYLHSLDDIFGTCYLSEKHFFDSLGIDEKVLETTYNFWNAFTKTTISHIDMYTNFRKMQFDTMVSLMKSYDNIVHLGMDYCSNTFSHLNMKT